MFAGKEKSDIFKIHSHGIIGGKEDHQRLFITQMGFGSHEYGGIRDAVCQLGKGISRTGSDCQCRKVEERKYFYFTTLIVTRDDVNEYMKYHAEYTKANRFKDIVCKIYI